MPDPWFHRDLAGPQTHALVIGVSHYTHLPGGDGAVGPNALGLRQLTAAARSASHFAHWLRDRADTLPAPLASVRLLLAPSAGEAPEVPETVLPTREAVKDALREWKRDCDQSRGHRAIVYVAGHGVQEGRDSALVLLADFNDPDESLLWGALDVGGCRMGMDHDGTASEQLWFVDACRVHAEVFDEFEELAGGLTLDVPAGGSASTSALFSSTAASQLAFAQPNAHTLFLTALLECLEGRAAILGAQADWQVTVASLMSVLPGRVRDVAASFDAVQEPAVGGTLRDTLIFRLPGRPVVSLRVELSPDAAAPSARGELWDDTAQLPIPDLPFTPALERSLEGGLWSLEVRFAPGSGFRPVRKLLFLRPPEVLEVLEPTPFQVDP